MGNSLQDQLLKAGLVSEEQVEKARARPKPRPAAGRKKPGPKKAAKKIARKASAPRRDKPSRPETAEDRERRELREMERQRNREAQRQQVNSRKIQERREKAKAFLNDHQVNVADGEIPYHFTVGSRIRHLYVNAEQRQALLAGTLAAGELADWILADRLPVRLQMQLHKHLWGEEPGR